MSVRVLLDTCALLWTANGDPIDSTASATLDQAAEVAVSPITAWEVGQLVARGRIALPMPPAAWFDTCLESGVTLAAMPPDVLIASSFLPGPPLRDPADRIVVATARAYGYVLMTRDASILAAGEAGHLKALAC